MSSTPKSADPSLGPANGLPAPATHLAPPSVVDQLDPEQLTRALEALRQREQRQAYLLKLSDALRPLADPVAVQYKAACVLGEFLGSNRVGYAETQPDRAMVAVTRNYTRDVPGIEGVYRYQDYGPDLLRRMEAGETVVRSDIAGDPSLTEAEKEAHAVLGLGATVNVPLVKEGRLMAILFVHFKQAHAFSAEEVALAEETAERTWASVERARSEDALRKSEERFRRLADALPLAVWVTDIQGNTEFLNKWWTEYSGIAYEPTTAWNIAAEIVHPDDASALTAAFLNALETGTNFEVEQRNRSASGEYRWFLNKGVPMRDSQTGEITQWVGAGVDVHDRKLADEALRQSEEKYRTLATRLDEQVRLRTRQLEQSVEDLRRSNHNLQQFAYVASHDLQEPLRKIQQFGDLLKELYRDQQGEGVGYLERMQAAAQRMSVLIRDLLAFSRIDTKQADSERVPLGTLLVDALTDLELVVAETGAEVRAEPLPTVRGDRLQLGQLFSNLLSNALKFRREKVAPIITVTARRVEAGTLPPGLRVSREAEAFHLIEVADNGIGFEEQYADRIFQVFQRLHGRQEYAGTGIGLAICAKVVANHGGAITAHSRPGEGAVFRVYLPV